MVCRFSALILSVLVPVCSSYSSVCFLPSTLDTSLSTPCANLTHASDSVTNITSAKGGVASFIVYAEPGPSSFSINFDIVDTDDFKFTHYEIGYVNVTETVRYNQSRTGWLSDPLLTPFNEGGGMATYVPAGESGSWLFVIDIAATAKAGSYNPELRISLNDGFSVHPVPLKIWDFSIPEISQGIFTELFVASNTATSTEDDHSDNSLGAIYAEAGGFTLDMKQKWFDLLSDSRIPPDDIYLSSPRPVEDYKYLNSTGQKMMGVMDVSGRAGGDGCANFSNSYVDSMIADLTPIVEELSSLGLLEKAYVYGFDEAPRECEAGVRNLFGAVKSKWPEIQTVAVLNWPGQGGGEMPTDDDFPVDVWTLQYQYYNETAAKAWTRTGRRILGYHCIEPSDASYLNTFIEHDLVETRLLMWYMAAREEFSGWLYYAVDLFATGCKPNPDPHTTVAKRLKSGLSSKIDWNPGNCIWKDQYGEDFFANGVSLES